MGMRTTKPAIKGIDDLEPEKKEALQNFIESGKRDKVAKKEYVPEVGFSLKMPQNMHRELKIKVTLSETKTTMNAVICDAIKDYLEKNK